MSVLDPLALPRLPARRGCDHVSFIISVVSVSASFLIEPLPQLCLGLHCPDAASLGEFDEAVRNGAITWHAFPHNAELSTINAETLLAGAELTHRLDARYNLPQKHVLSQRDVPGFPRGAVAAAVAANITALSEGMNGRIVPPREWHVQLADGLCPGEAH